MFKRILVAVIVGVVAAGPSFATGKLSSIFQFDMLNARVAYLEAITGPAMHVFRVGTLETREYRVDGCRILAYAHGEDVVAYSLYLAPKCNFDLGQFLGNGYSVTNGLTIGKFAQGSFGPDLIVQSACIYLCGNAADPTVDFTFDGPHAVNFVKVTLTVVLASNAAIDAANQWQQSMLRHENENYIANTRFNCDQKYAPQAVQFFQNVRVDQVTIGSVQPDGPFYTKSCPR